jgi:hypothetical protein
MAHELRDAGGRDAAETLQRWGKPKKVMGGGEEKEKEENKGGK